MEKDELSSEGERLYDEYGYHETTIPFLHKDYKEMERERGSPFYITFNFVLDEDLQETFDSFDYEDQHMFFTKSRIRELLNRGFVCDVMEVESMIESVADFREELDRMQFFDD